MAKIEKPEQEKNGSMDVSGAADLSEAPAEKIPESSGSSEKSLFESIEEDVDQLVEVVVADGRSIWDGIKHHLSGAKLMVSRDEADALKRKGAVQDPQASSVPKGKGPSFTPESGPKIVDGQ